MKRSKTSRAERRIVNWLYGDMPAKRIREIETAALEMAVLIVGISVLAVMIA